VEGRSHVIFGLAGAVVVDSLFHISGPPLLGSGPLTVDEVTLKAIYYGFAALGALAPDIDNARSTIGQRAGFVSKGIQHLAGHRKLFHSIMGLALVGMFVWALQYVVGLELYRLGLHLTGTYLGAGVQPGLNLVSGKGVAFVALLTGYFLHLVADSLTIGGVPWLYPSDVRFGFPPNRKWRFRSGSWMEPVVVGAVCVLVAAGVVTHYLTF
jgi:inner membrane protein